MPNHVKVNLIKSFTITVLQGDPGDGKSTFAINLVALLTKGLPMPGRLFFTRCLFTASAM